MVTFSKRERTRRTRWVNKLTMVVFMAKRLHSALLRNLFLMVLSMLGKAWKSGPKSLGLTTAANKIS